ncbi:hypothetical protein PMAYCL1PPCAC_07553, partial [Pristionchus mayeri]
IAIKIINKTIITVDYRNKLPIEIELWKKLKQANLVKMFYQEGFIDRIFLFMEYGSAGDMKEFLQKHGPVHEATASLWMRQVISGISYIHKMGLVHRDLKLENIIIFSPTTVKIANFSRMEQDANAITDAFRGLKSYSAPEILSGQPYNPYKADVWSMGVIAYSILTNRKPLNDSMSDEDIV